MRLLAYLLLAIALPMRASELAWAAARHPAAPAQAGPLVAARLRVLLRSQAAAPALGTALLEPAATRDFYRRRAYAPAWMAGPQPTAAGRAALALLAHADDYGLLPRHYHAPALRALADSLARPAAAAQAQAARQARFEALLTDGLVQLVRHLRRGQLRGATPSPLERAGVPFAPGDWVAAALRAPDFTAAVLRCQPPQREYRLLQRALARSPHAPYPTALARQRAQQLALNLERWRWLAIPDSAYVLLNLPACWLHVVRRGRVVHTQRLLIGAPASPTPVFSGRLTGFTLAPEWVASPTEAATQLLPYLQANAEFATESTFLADNNYSIYDSLGRAIDPDTVDWRALSARHFPYTIRQGPGAGNPLGYLAFELTGSPGVYLYGAAGPPYFNQPVRALETTDVRLEQPLWLAAYLLGPDDPRRATLPPADRCAALTVPQHYRLRHPLPVHVRYATCAVVGGQVQFYPDVYGQDAALGRQLFGPEPGGLVATNPPPPL